jgi:hypothetical protein
MFGKYNGFVSKARVSACMYFLVTRRTSSILGDRDITFDNIKLGTNIRLLSLHFIIGLA